MLTKKSGILVAAGAALAAFALYKYSKMSREEKDSLKNSIKEKGREFANHLVPENIKSRFAGAAEGRPEFTAGS
jgi:hypothetical protein